MTLTEPSELVGVTIVNLSILKNGRARAIRFSTLTRLCEVLDCQPGDLLTWHKTPRLTRPAPPAWGTPGKPAGSGKAPAERRSREAPRAVKVGRGPLGDDRQAGP
jgi:putative transcriptional regulator